MRKIISIISVIVISLFMYSCSKISGSDDERELRFEKEYFYVDDEIIETYRSLDVISIVLKPDIDIDEFQQYISSKGLQLISSFNHIHYSILRDFQLPGPLILLLPENADYSQYYSFSENLTEDSFANNRFIKYSLPAYTHDIENPGWYYPNNKISVKPKTDDFSVSEFSEQFNLEFQSKNVQIDLYNFIDNQFLHGSPYELAVSIYNSGDYRYVVPDGYWEIVRH